MRAVDTNVLVRLILFDDLRQAAAADAFVKPGAWVSVLALAEAMWVMSAVYERSASEIANALEMILDHQSLTVQDPLIVGAALKIFREHPKLGFSDCLMLQIARSAGHLPFGTFDRQLSRVDGCQKLG